MSKNDENGLFVHDDEDMESETASVSLHEEGGPDFSDDPVIESIPLVLNTLPQRATQSMHILQFPGRPKTRPFATDLLRAAVKPELQVVEVRVPLDTHKFYDEARSEEWGVRVEEHALQGVLNRTDGVLYAGQILADAGSKKIVLVPVDSTTQLKPSFKYLDDIETQRLNQRRMDSGDHKPGNVQILQTSAKSTQIPDGAAAALGESLKHMKRLEEEDWHNLSWRTSDDSGTVDLKHALAHGADGVVLETDTTMAEYIDQLAHY